MKLNDTDFIKIVIDVVGISIEAFNSDSRLTPLVKSRQFVHYFTHKYHPEKSLSAIAEITGNKHANAVNSIKKIDELEFNKWQPYLGYKKEIQRRILNTTPLFIYSKYSLISYTK